MRRRPVRIGELAKKTGVPTRMLRYYEEQGLITPRRLENGYREYDGYLIDRVHKIRGLLDAGVPTRIIGDMLPCLNQGPEIVVTNPDPELREMLIAQRDKMTERIAFLEQNRDALIRYIEAMDIAAGLLPARSAR
jgi:DNA-binding transcriptional MerR regulator